MNALFETDDRARMNAILLARHAKRILRFALTYGPQAVTALDDVLSTLHCGEGYQVTFVSRIYEDAWELINAVGPEAAELIGEFILAYTERHSAMRGKA